MPRRQALSHCLKQGSGAALVRCAQAPPLPHPLRYAAHFPFQGRTRLFDRHGKLVTTFQSALPGGSRSSSRRAREFCLVDGLLNGITNTLYLLDVLCWRSEWPRRDGGRPCRCEPRALSGAHDRLFRCAARRL